MESSTRLPLATTSGSIASIEPSDLGPSPALAASLASVPLPSSLAPTPSHPSTILSPPSHSRRLSNTSSSSSTTLAPPPAKSRTLTQLLAAPLRTVASSASGSSGASSTVYGARRSRAHGPAVLGQAASSSTKADESFDGKVATNADWDEINLEMDIEAAGGSGSSRREEGLGRRDHIEEGDSMSVGGEEIALTDLKSPARPSFSQRTPSKKDVRPRRPSDIPAAGGSESAIRREEEAPIAGPSSGNGRASISQASPRQSLGHSKAYDYANASTTDLPEDDDDEEEEGLLYRGQADDETIQHCNFNRAYAPPPDIYDDDNDEGLQPSNREAPSSSGRRRLDFEALTGRERASYWITALLVLGLFIVGIAIGVDWIDWPGDGIGKD